MRILAIETSCDETAAAVVEDLPVGLIIISNVVASSKAMHEKYGGVVPEVAAREQLTCIIPVIQETAPSLSEIDAIAVTIGPGLIGSLLVGVETAKTIAFVTGKPIIPVNHVLAHVYANFINNKTVEFPAVSLVVSGGHTELYLMKSVKDLTWLGGTLDDAAGECFDKTARLLGFGNGGGPAIEKAAKLKIKTLNFKLPRPMMNDESLNFSFSGLKTAVMRELHKVAPCDPARCDLAENTKVSFAYEIQEAITDVLVKKTLHAAKQYDAKSILLSGGVAANSRLREKFKVLSLQFKVVAPPAPLCTDNAVMIASCAHFLGSFTQSPDGPADWHAVIATPDLPVEVYIPHVT